MKSQGSSQGLRHFLRLAPKVGPFSGLAFQPPTSAVEQMYMSSFNETLLQYRALLRAQQERWLQLPNHNLDTGAVTEPVTYRLTDETYAKLLRRTTSKTIPNVLRRDFLSYCADLEKPFANKQNSKAWHKLIKELDTLRSTPEYPESGEPESFVLERPHNRILRLR